MQKKFIAGAVTAAVMLPALVFAQTADVQVQMQSLLSQIQALQLQLKNLLASSTANIKIKMDGERIVPGQVGKAMCLRLARNLSEGSQGEDVRALQEMLLEDRESGFTGNATGFFGPLTARAMAKFQIRTGIASSTNGMVGPLTRGFFERTCGKGLGEMTDDEKRGRIRGEITAAAASSITVKSENGDTRIVNITASTAIHVLVTATSTPTVGSMADLTVGKKVAAAGTANADGSLTALEIKVGIVPPPPPPVIQKIQKILKFDHRGKRMDDNQDD